MKISSKTSLSVKEICDFALGCFVQPHVNHKHKVGHAGIETEKPLRKMEELILALRPIKVPLTRY